MKTQVEDVNQVTKKIQVEIPWEDVDRHVQQAVRTIKRAAKIPGFRPGKAPDSVVRSRYAQHIRDEVVQHLIPEAFRTVVDENKYDVVSEPQVSDVMYSDGSPFLFKLTIETRPQVTAENYQGLELEPKPYEIKDEEVESLLKMYQQRAAELIPLADTPAAAGHFLAAHVRADILAGKKKNKVFDRRTMIEVGSEDNHPAFNENLAGKLAGERVEFDAEYAADHPEKLIAGKTIHYEVRIESVNERRLPEIDDEFARDLGEFSTLEDLKGKIRKDIDSHKSADQRSRYKDEILKQLVDAQAFEVPQSMVKQETENLLNEYVYTMQRSGANLEDVSIDWNEVHKKLSEQAERNIRGVLILQAIAQKENITVAEEDIEQAVARLADQQRRAPEAVRAELVKEQRMERLQSNIRIGKTLDFLLDHAHIKSV